METPSLKLRDFLGFVTSFRKFLRELGSFRSVLLNEQWGCFVQAPPSLVLLSFLGCSNPKRTGLLDNFFTLNQGSSYCTKYTIFISQNSSPTSHNTWYIPTAFVFSFLYGLKPYQAYLPNSSFPVTNSWYFVSLILGVPCSNSCDSLLQLKSLTSPGSLSLCNWCSVILSCNPVPTPALNRSILRRSTPYFLLLIIIKDDFMR